MTRTGAARWLVGIIAVAVVLRVAAALYMGDQVSVLPGIHDQVSYDALARRVLAGHGFTFATDWWPTTATDTPTAFWSYLYTLYLAGVYAVAGAHPLVARLVQAAVAGVVGPWLAWRLGRRVAGDAVGLAAAAITAAYIYFIYYSAALMTETFFILAVMWALDRTMELGENMPSGRTAFPGPGWGTALQLGLALGLAALLRQLSLALVPVLMVWLAWRWWGNAGRLKSRLGGAVPAGGQPANGPPAATSVAGAWLKALGLLVVPLIVIGLLIAPWTARNYAAFGRFVLLNTNAGYAFFWANHPIYGTQFVGILPPDGPSYQDLIPPELRGLDEPALEQALLRRGVGFVVDEPGRYLLLSLSRVGEYFKFWPSAGSGLVSNVSRVLSFGLFLPFMLFGLVRAARDWRRWSLLYLFVAVYTLIHLLSWALVRYRLPVDAVLIVFAGVGVSALVARMVTVRRAAVAAV